MKKLKELNWKIDMAINAMELELQKCWPLSSRVLVKLRCNQKEPTSGEVKGYYKNYIKVKIDSAKENSRRKLRFIYFENVVS